MSLRSKVRESLSKMIDTEDDSLDAKKHIANSNIEEMNDEVDSEDVPFQKHSSLLGNIIEKIDSHQKLLKTVAQDNDEPMD